jgi:RIO kinase 1
MYFDRFINEIEFLIIMAGQERFKTYGNVFDEFTRRNLFKLQCQGFFEELVSPISIGKEANIFSARTKEGGYVAIKIYRLENCNFNKMWSYLMSDPRYKNSKPQRRQIIFTWVQREFRNLMKSREAGVHVPTPIHFLHNIIIEEFLGKGNIPAPQLNRAEIKDIDKLHELLVKELRLLYKKAELVHADLSSFNILLHEGKPVIIDMSQSTSTNDPNSTEYLARDIKNIAKFLNKFGFEISDERLHEEITKNI